MGIGIAHLNKRECNNANPNVNPLMTSLTCPIHVVYIFIREANYVTILFNGCY